MSNYPKRRSIIHSCAVRTLCAVLATMGAGIIFFDNPSQATTDHLPAPKHFAKVLYMRQGGDKHQWACLNALWNHESHWNFKAHNSSGAHGIPQALPATKMAQFGRDYKTNYQTQIRWGLLYIKLHWDNNACNALKHDRRHNWY